MCCRNESARDAARAPAAQDDASSHFLTVGTLGGNSAGCGLKGLYRASFSARFRRQGPNTSLPRSHRAGIAVPSQPTPRLPVGASSWGGACQIGQPVALAIRTFPALPNGWPRRQTSPGARFSRRSSRRRLPALRHLAFGFDSVGGMKVVGIVSREGSIPHVAEGRDVVPVNGYCGQENA